MKAIKSVEEAENSGLAPNIAALARCMVEDLQRIYADEIGEPWNPETDGYVVVIEESDKSDDPGIVELFGRSFHETTLEGATYEDGAYLSCHLWNNDEGLSLIVVDGPAMDPVIREKMEAELGGGEDG